VDEVRAILFASEVATVGRWRCPVGHPLFRDSGPARRYLFCFPRTSVWIQHDGGEPFVADPNTVTYYNQGQTYRRMALSARGDRGDWFAVAPHVIAELLAAWDPAARDRQDRPFTFSHGPCDADTYLLQRGVFEHVTRERSPDTLFVEESVLHILSRTAALAYAGADIEQAAGSRRRARDLAEAARVNTLISSVGYFATLRMPIVQGRDFSDADTADGAPVVIVNEALVRRHFPQGDPLGRRLGTGFDGMTPVREIVGVVQDTHDRGVAAEPMPTAYIPFRQFSLPYAAIALRTGVTPASVIPVVRDRLQRLSPAVPLSDFQGLDTRLRESLREPRFYTLMAATCAAMAVLFVTFGLYGLVSYSVSRRTSELGIRMAVGAESRTILRMVLLQGLRMAVVGVTAGLALAVLLSRAVASLLFQVKPFDPLTLSAAAAIVVLVTLAASYAPARRASRVNPITALRGLRPGMNRAPPTPASPRAAREATADALCYGARRHLNKEPR
jgi:hypothetical protein